MAVKLINDCVHGMVAVPDYAAAVMATPLFQRLGRVKQLGCLHLAWPSAVHTRMEHSIGTMHLALTYARVLGLGEADTRHLALASLLHDIAHGPFSHTFEKAAAFDHDAFRHDLLQQCPHLTAAMDARTRAAVADVWSGKARVLHELLAGVAGVDRMDYLVRDSYHTTPQCRLDTTCVQSIMAHTEVDWAGERVLFSPKGSQYVCHLLDGREYMYREVYLHRKALAGDELLVRAFRAGLGASAAPLLTPATFEALDDAWVTSRAWDEGAHAAPLRQYLRADLPAAARVEVEMVAPPTDSGRSYCMQAGQAVGVYEYWQGFRRVYGGAGAVGRVRCTF